MYMYSALFRTRYEIHV